MKKIIAMLLVAIIGLSIVGCGQNTQKINTKNDSNYVIKESPDKYTWYIKNYVGRNCAQFGVPTFDNIIVDFYGQERINLSVVTEDGTFFDVCDDDELKNYIVASQSVKPNTELKYKFAKNADGSESDTDVVWQNIEEIVLTVREVG